MATGAPGTNGVWQYGEDDSEATFSALLNKAASTTDTQLGADRTRLTALELPGRVVNTESVAKTTVFSTTSTTYVDVTGMSATITPKASTNKILVTVTFLQSNSTTTAANRFRILRGTTPIGETVTGGFSQPYASNVNGFYVATMYLDAPASTSAQTYKLQMLVTAASTGYVGAYSLNTGQPSLSTITLQEIKA